MKILAIETSDKTGSIALLDGNHCLVSLDLPVELRSARSLAPAIKTALATAGWSPRDVKLVAIANGPGSFTGLRVGVVTAKTFAYAVGAEVLAIDTLSVIADQANCETLQLSVIIDAQRGEVFAARYVREGSERWNMVAEPAIVTVETWLAGLTSNAAASEGRAAKGIAVSGPALMKLAAKVPATVAMLDQACWRPLATTVARLAWRRYQARQVQAEQRDDLWSLAPLYLRKSAAEEKLASKELEA